MNGAPIINVLTTIYDLFFICLHGPKEELFGSQVASSALLSTVLASIF